MSDKFFFLLLHHYRTLHSFPTRRSSDLLERDNHLHIPGKPLIERVYPCRHVVSIWTIPCCVGPRPWIHLKTCKAQNVFSVVKRGANGHILSNYFSDIISLYSRP